MGVAARRVRLPDLDELSAQRLAVGPEHSPGHDDPLPERLTGVLPRQVVVELADRPVPEDRPCELRQRVRQDDERLLRCAQPRPDVVGVVVRRVDHRPLEVWRPLECDLGTCHVRPPARS